MRRGHFLSLGLVCVLALVACGGNEGGDPPGTTPSGTAGSPATTTGGGQQPTTPTTGASQSDAEGISVEIDGTRYEFSIRKDIPIPGRTNSMFATICNPNVFRMGIFSVFAIKVESDGGTSDAYWVLEVGLRDSGEVEDPGFVMRMRGGPDEREYRIVWDDPGTWTISGNHLAGELNISYSDGGTEHETTATLDFTCPE